MSELNNNFPNCEPMAFATSDLNYAEMRKAIEALSPPTERYGLPAYMISMPLISSPWLSPTAPAWVPPKDAFVEFEQSDESWAAPLGFGKYEERKVYYGINTRCLMKSYTA